MTETVDIDLDSIRVYHPDPSFDPTCAMLGQIRQCLEPLTPLKLDLVRADLAKRAKVDIALLEKRAGDKRRPLRIHVVRRFPYELIATNGSLNQISESMRVARDGRALATSCEFAAAKLFGLRIADNSNQEDFDAYGMRRKNNRNVVTTHSIRTLTTHGVKTVKSSKVGGGRQSTDEDVVAYVDSVDSMILIDVTNVHTFSIMDIPSAEFLAMLRRRAGSSGNADGGYLMKKIKYPAFWDALLKSFYLEFVEIGHDKLFFQDVVAAIGSGALSREQAKYMIQQVKYELGHKLRIVAEAEAAMDNNPYFNVDVLRMDEAKHSLALKHLVGGGGAIAPKVQPEKVSQSLAPAAIRIRKNLPAAKRHLKFRPPLPV